MRTCNNTLTTLATLALTSAALAQAPLPVPVGQPAAAVDLMTSEGIGAFNAQWRYSDVKIVEIAHTKPAPPGSDRNTPGPANTTYDISPRAGEAGFDDSAWEVIGADTLGQRRAGGKVCFNWYRINLTMPANIGDFATSGCTAVLNVTVDDYAEVWVNGQLPRALDADNPNLVQGFNTPNRVTIAQDVKPGYKVQVAIFAINGPISAAPTNYIWFRNASVEFFPKPHALAPHKGGIEVVQNDPAIGEVIPRDAALEQVVKSSVPSPR